jgi:hypothetical protein
VWVRTYSSREEGRTVAPDTGEILEPVAA